MKLKVDKKFQKSNRSPEPVRFAEQVCRKWAKSLGLKWKVRVELKLNPDYQRYGYAWEEKPGVGRVFLSMPGFVHPYIDVDPRFKNQPGYYLSGFDESLVFLAGHEFGHIIGYDGDKAGEMACDKLGYRCVLAWRDRQYQDPACLI